jgi:hypothetical protein
VPSTTTLLVNGQPASSRVRPTAKPASLENSNLRLTGPSRESDVPLSSLFRALFPNERLRRSPNEGLSELDLLERPGLVVRGVPGVSLSGDEIGDGISACLSACVSHRSDALNPAVVLLTDPCTQVVSSGQACAQACAQPASTGGGRKGSPMVLVIVITSTKSTSALLRALVLPKTPWGRSAEFTRDILLCLLTLDLG